MKSIEYERLYQSRRRPDSTQGQPFEERCCIQITRHVPAPSKPLGPFFHWTASNQETSDEPRTERIFKCRLGLLCCPFYSSKSVLHFTCLFSERETNQPLGLRAIWSSCNQVTNAFFCNTLLPWEVLSAQPFCSSSKCQVISTTPTTQSLQAAQERS